MSEVAAYVGIGSNLGDAIGNVQRALHDLNQLPGTRLTAQSDLFRTEPIEAAGDDYVNAVARLHTSLSPQELLQQLQALELSYGRERPYLNAPRTLDLDILLYNDQKIASDELLIPHPRLTQRAFALIPLLQIDPFVTIPGLGPAHSFVPGVTSQQISKILLH